MHASLGFVQMPAGLFRVTAARSDFRQQQVGVEHKGGAAVADLQQPCLHHHFGFVGVALLQQQLALREQQPPEQRVRLRALHGQSVELASHQRLRLPPLPLKHQQARPVDVDQHFRLMTALAPGQFQ
ncbi:hypothetical protein D3C75_705140 [compost metagenome]